MNKDGLGARQLHLHGTARHIAEQRSMVLYRHILLAAKAAAHQHILYMAVVVIHAQHTGALVQGRVGALVGGQQLHAAVFHRYRHAALRLQEGVLRPGRREMLGDHILGLGNGAGGITAADIFVCLHIVLVLFEHERCILSLGLFNTVNSGKLFVRHLHQLAGAIGCLLIHCADKGHAVAQIMGDLTHTNQCRLIFLDMTDIHLAGNVLPGQHSHHALQSLSLRGVDGQNTGTGELRAHGCAVTHTVHIHIVRILTVSQYLLLYVEAVDTAAHLPIISRSRGKLTLTEDLSGQQNGVNDLYISGAAADVIANSKSCLLAGGIRIHIQQRLGRDHHAGDTETALNGTGLTECEGVDLLLPIAQTLHRYDGLPF